MAHRDMSSSQMQPDRTTRAHICDGLALGLAEPDGNNATQYRKLQLMCAIVKDATSARNILGAYFLSEAAAKQAHLASLPHDQPAAQPAAAAGGCKQTQMAATRRGCYWRQHLLLLLLLLPMGAEL